MDPNRELSALVALLRGSETRPAMPAASLREQLLGCKPSELLYGLEDLVSQVEGFDEEIKKSSLDLFRWRGAGLDIHSYLDELYPAPFREAHDSPLLVFSRGVSATDEMTMAIVGSRNPEPRAAMAARSISLQLAEAGVTIVSGLARGIDAQAHLGALEGGGRTVAVLGHGLLAPTYPPEHGELLERILTGGGQALSQFWPESRPRPVTFPMRNVTMSAFSRATVILAAGEKSGTKHQAQAAVKHGRYLLLHRAVIEETSWGMALYRNGLAVKFDSASGVLDWVRSKREQAARGVTAFA